MYLSYINTISLLVLWVFDTHRHSLAGWAVRQLGAMLVAAPAGCLHVPTQPVQQAPAAKVSSSVQQVTSVAHSREVLQKLEALRVHMSVIVNRKVAQVCPAIRHVHIIVIKAL